MSMFIRQRWIDPRLKHTKVDGKKFIELDTTVMDAVWIPDLYILNEKKASHHDVTVPNKLMHIYPDGLVVYSVRVTGTFSCSMLLHKYPLDTQKCSFVMESYGYSVDTLLLRWNKVPVERSPILSLPQFELGEIKSYTCDKEYAGGIYIFCVLYRISLYS
ncbi:hypothetical protein KUTeg_020917 [Tegillarca granosa]|uniref:Neurotransmitter-gated ion-channel ligand-binding domain-containing protein n=1 Tax=Tegillarca granosa TaxID=220873 RepID=A0ABQ9EEK5_TEGGR|nr:hypothetical protein KUTeg_020917 [Tegillarca granosa]